MPECEYLGSKRVEARLELGTPVYVKTVGEYTIFGTPHGIFIDYTVSPPMPKELVEIVTRELGINNPMQPQQAQLSPTPTDRQGGGFYGRRQVPYMQRGKIPGISHLAAKR